MILAYIITLSGVKHQVQGAERCIQSIKDTKSDIKPIIHEATTPDTIERDVRDTCLFNYNKYRWNWPTNDNMNGLDIQSGLYKSRYKANDDRKVEACFVSHLRLWDRIAGCTGSYGGLILEADALFTRQFNPQDFKGKYLVGLNDPRGATRRADMFHYEASKVNGFSHVPTVNTQMEPPYPQGIAGNSAYYISQPAATKLLKLVEEYGGWPNDAIMCKELLPRMRVVYPYYTRVQNLPSTTTG